MKLLLLCAVSALAVPIAGAAPFLVPLPDHCESLYAGSPWRISTPVAPPMLMIHDKQTGEPCRSNYEWKNGKVVGNCTWQGFAVDFWTELAKTCHFNFTIRLPGQVSNDLANYDFNEATTTMRFYGLANKDVWEFNRSDIYMSSFYVNSVRLNNSLMTQPLMNTPLQLGELASVDEAAAKGMFGPFKTETWVMWFGTTVIAAFVFWFLDAGAAGENFQHHERADWRNLRDNFWISCWLSWSTLTGGNAHRPTTGLGRAFSAVWTFFCLIMIATYTANLATHLIFGSLSTEIESFDHMKESGKRLCVLKGTAYSTYLKNEWKGITIVERPASVWAEGGMVEAMLNGDCDAFTDSGIYMHYAQHKRCLAREDPAVNEWSKGNPCHGACENRLMQHLLRTGKKIIMAPEKVEFGLQDNAIGLHKRHAAILDDLNFHIFSMRMSKTMANLMKKHLLDRPQAECLGAGGDVDEKMQIAFHHLNLAFYGVLGFAGIFILIRLLQIVRERGQGHDLLINFLNERYPSLKPRQVVQEWEASWELRWKMHPLVTRYLCSIDSEKMRAWTQRGSRIRNVDMVKWAEENNDEDEVTSFDQAHSEDSLKAFPSTPSPKPTSPSKKHPSLRGAARRVSIVALAKRGGEIREQFTGEGYNLVVEEQKQLLLETLVTISSQQLEKTMRQRLFRSRIAGSASIRRQRRGSKQERFTKAEVSKMMAEASAIKYGKASASASGSGSGSGGSRVAPDS